MTRTMVAVLVVGFAATCGLAGSHLWDVNEVFSNADGTIQFVELWESYGAEFEGGVAGHPISSAYFGHAFVIENNLVPPTTNRYLLFATQAFADLPGAPTPDQIIPPGVVPFFHVGGDIVTYHPYDSFAFGAVPTDGIHSLNRLGGIAINSPTNYAGQTGSVDASGGDDCPGDLNGDSSVDLNDLTTLLSNFGTPSGATPEQGDINGDGAVDLSDLTLLLSAFGTICQ